MYADGLWTRRPACLQKAWLLQRSWDRVSPHFDYERALLSGRVVLAERQAWQLQLSCQIQNALMIGLMYCRMSRGTSRGEPRHRRSGNEHLQ